MPHAAPPDAPAARPLRPRLPDWSGSPVSLPAEVHAWRELAPAPTPDAPLLLLGLGPEAVCAPLAARGPGPVFWLDAPAMLDWRRAQALPAPEGARPVSVEAAPALAGRCRVLFYAPGMRLFPHFWGPLLGRLDAARLRPDPADGTADTPGTRPVIVLPGDETTLLHQELTAAATALRLPVAPWPARPPEQPAAQEALLRRLARLPGAATPLFLSVNLRGLDTQGRVAHACRALGIRLAVWFVDMPWHVLSGLRLPWWRELSLFATDASFLAPLRAAGARRADFLPLAAARHMWREPAAEPSRPPLFVGRASFPAHARFFAAARRDEALHARAQALLAAYRAPGDPLPDIHWWQTALGVPGWPGMAVRQAGLGADDCSRRRRTQWLAAAVRAGFEICGDAAWADLLPGVNVLPPVDYYGQLPACYTCAEAVLNVTSLLLPHSLSQRHFDVWAAGGFLFSDPTPGLRIFPPELVRPMRLSSPGELPARLTALRADAAARAALREAWRKELRARHTYAHRLLAILDMAD